MALPLYDERPSRGVPWVTWALIAVNTIVFLSLQPTFFQSFNANEVDNEVHVSLKDLREAETFMLKWGLVPCEASSHEIIADGASCNGTFREYAKSDPADKSWLFAFISAMFVHGNVLHLVGNMLFLWIFGRSVEPRLRAPGYLAFYLVTGIIAGLTYIVFHSDSPEPLVGASGAIAGVMGAYIVLYPRARIMTLVPGFVFQLVYIPAFVLLGLFFVGQFFTPEIAHVAWEAHVGGMVAGAAGALALKHWLPRPQTYATTF